MFGLETLLGGALGGILRLVPEFIKLFDRAAERKHELALQASALEFEKLRGTQKMQEYGSVLNIEEIKALATVSAAQTQITGIKWVDAVNMTVRPFVTYYFLIIFGVAKASALKLALQVNAEWEEVAVKLWTPENEVIMSSILGYWFVDRTLRHMRG